MAKNFNLQNDEKIFYFCKSIQKAGYYFKNVLHRIIYMFLTAKAIWNFLFLIVIFKLF